MTTEEAKKAIDAMSYEQLLRRWRHAPIGDPFFQGEVGKYFSTVMTKKRGEDPDEAVRASKSIGW